MNNPAISFTIREAKIADARGIATVRVDTWRSTYAGIIPQSHLDALSYEKGEAKQKACLTKSIAGTKYFVAEDEDCNILGFSGGGHYQDKDIDYPGELFVIYILKDYQRRGIGTGLFQCVVDHLISLGHYRICTWVLALNPHRAFYEKLDGKKVAEKYIEISGKELKEIAYGWSDITSIRF